MKKLILISLLTLGSSLFADSNIGVRIQTSIGDNTTLDIGFRSDDHRYDNRYRNFDYPRYGYYDNFGYYFGYFDRHGYFYNNIYFTYDNRYTYYDRLNHRGYFKPNAGHYRTYIYHKNNDWNKKHQYREINKPIYGAYYDKNYTKQRIVEKQYNHKNEKDFRNNSNQQNQQNQQNQKNYKEQNSKQNQKDYKNNNNNQQNQRSNKEQSSNQNQRNDKNNKEQFIEEQRNNR